MNVLTTPAGRWYEKDGHMLMSVTTIIGRYLQIGPETDEARARWEELGRRGSEIHDLLARAVSLEEWGALPETHRQALMARERFRNDYGFKRDDCELAMGSVELGYAGRLDDVGRIPSGRVLVDYKTGLLRPRSLRMQLGAYYGLHVATYPRRRIFGALGVGLNVKSGAYTVQSFSIVDLVAAYNEFMEVKEEISGQRNGTE